MIRARRSCLLAASLLALACAKPASDQVHVDASGGPDELGGGRGIEGVETGADRADVDEADDEAGPDEAATLPPAAPLVPAEAPNMRCPASKLAKVRYGSTVDASVELRAQVAKRRCVDDVWTKLEDDIDCANAFNQAAWEHAYYEAGLALVEPSAAAWIETRSQLGSGLETESDDSGQTRVELEQYDEDDCSGAVLHTRIGLGPRLALNRDGELVAVVAKPKLDERSYVECSCFPGCGMMHEATASYAVLAAGIEFAGVVEISYPAIAISTSVVEFESCCCAP